MASTLGIAGRIAKLFLTSRLTALIAAVGLMVGLMAVAITPREEEPQVDVTFANVFVSFPGATAEEVENLVSIPAEQVLSELEGVKHVYSMSRPGLATVTVEFEVGQDRLPSLVRLYNQVYSNRDWLPEKLGVGQPIVKPRGIDDVPILTLTLWSKDAGWGGYELSKVAHALEVEFKAVPGTRGVSTLDGVDDVVAVTLDPYKLAGYKIVIEDLRRALLAANVSLESGTLIGNNEEIPLTAGTFLTRSDEVSSLVIGQGEKGPIYLGDVATVERRSDQPKQYIWFGRGPSGVSGDGVSGQFPAVTISVAKKPGTDAAVIARRVLERVDELRNVIIPPEVEVTVTRNYGATASDKARALIIKLVFATGSVIALAVFALGWREAVVVGAAVALTVTITLFASWLSGFTINRISLFAIIFSIGILVDDAIVVVENIHRHWHGSRGALLDLIPGAVDEVGGPTILATFTVIAALLPMAFVSGLMGPYMSPIPINASMGMAISMFIAFAVTPWLCLKVLGSKPGTHDADTRHAELIRRWADRILRPFFEGRNAALRRMILLGGAVGLVVGSALLVAMGGVVLKMLPFDNKSEFQVVVDLPEGNALEQTAAALAEMGNYLAAVPEVENYQVYAGTASPINFNGLVRQYYLREGSHRGDIQVNLVDKSQRDRRSHDIALAVREQLTQIAKRYAADVKIVEVPPGPPVMSPIVAEIYGLNLDERADLAKDVRRYFEKSPNVVDVDDSVDETVRRYILAVDRQRAARYGVTQEDVAQSLAATLAGEDIGFLRDSSSKYAVPIRIQVEPPLKSDLNILNQIMVRARDGALIPLSSLVNVQDATRERTRYHKDLAPVTYVVGDVGGGTDSPLYSMFAISNALRDDNFPINQQFLRVPQDRVYDTIKWDGEWQITYETFRDMGLAYLVGIVLIYLLVVAQFQSYFLPLVIMAPIPLTLIGVMPGHALMGAQFTATSMIGMMALAGIIVRNSILLVDFVQHARQEGGRSIDALIEGVAVRTKPIALTALAAMMGALFLIDDPIFNGLAVSLLFGILVATLLTLVVIPVLYFSAMQWRRQRRRRAAESLTPGE